jgi:hypothetical protein
MKSVANITLTRLSRIFPPLALLPRPKRNKPRMSRTATVARKTSETEISCTITLDNDPLANTQVIDVSTGIGFLDHVSHQSTWLIADVHCFG